MNEDPTDVINCKWMEDLPTDCEIPFSATIEPLTVCAVIKRSEWVSECSYLEPVNGTAVDERREHPETVPEGITNGTHCQNDMEVLLHSLYKEVIHGEGGGVNLASLRASCHLHFLNDLCLLIRGVQVWYIT